MKSPIGSALFVLISPLLILAAAPIDRPLPYASDARLFSEGLAAVQMGARTGFNEANGTTSWNSDAVKLVGRWGFIDTTGQFLLPARYEAARDFSEQLAAVRIDSKWGAITHTGRFAVKPSFDLLTSFKYGMAVATVGSQTGVVSRTGAFVLEPKYQMATILSPSLIAVKTNDLWGLVAPDGTWIVQPVFQSIFAPVNGKLTVTVTAFNRAIRYGLISDRGNILLEPKYETLVRFPNGLVHVKLDNLWGVATEEGQTVVEPKYSRIDPSGDGVIPVQMNGQWGLLRDDGTVVVAPVYETVLPFHDGVAGFKTGGKWGIIDTRGNIVTPPAYDFVGPFSEGRAVFGVKTFLGGMKYGYLDTQGKVVVEADYRSAGMFREHLAGVCTGGFTGLACGYITPDGATAIPLAFTAVSPFKNGFARVMMHDLNDSKKSRSAYINTRGETVLTSDKPSVDTSSPALRLQLARLGLPPELYALLTSDVTLGEFKDGIAQIGKNGRFGLIDLSGKVIVAPRYKSISPFQEGLAKAVTETGEGVYIDPTGAVVIR